MRGEGLFIEFREEALQRWLAGVVQHQHNHTFRDAHIQWRKVRRREYPEQGYPELRYVLLHSCASSRLNAAIPPPAYVSASTCERGNKYLDRSVLVPTMDRADLAFFEA